MKPTVFFFVFSFLLFFSDFFLNIKNSKIAFGMIPEESIFVQKKHFDDTSDIHDLNGWISFFQKDRSFPTQTFRECSFFLLNLIEKSEYLSLLEIQKIFSLWNNVLQNDEILFLKYFKKSTFLKCLYQKITQALETAENFKEINPFFKEYSLFLAKTKHTLHTYDPESGSFENHEFFSNLLSHLDKKLRKQDNKFTDFITFVTSMQRIGFHLEPSPLQKTISRFISEVVFKEDFSALSFRDYSQIISSMATLGVPLPKNWEDHFFRYIDQKIPKKKTDSLSAISLMRDVSSLFYSLALLKTHWKPVPFAIHSKIATYWEEMNQKQVRYPFFLSAKDFHRIFLANQYWLFVSKAELSKTELSKIEKMNQDIFRVYQSHWQNEAPYQSQLQIKTGQLLKKAYPKHFFQEEVWQEGLASRVDFYVSEKTDQKGSWIQVDGPSHFFFQSFLPTPKTHFQDQLLKAFGENIVRFSYYNLSPLFSLKSIRRQKEIFAQMFSTTQPFNLNQKEVRTLVKDAFQKEHEEIQDLTQTITAFETSEGGAAEGKIDSQRKLSTPKKRVLFTQLEFEDLLKREKEDDPVALFQLGFIYSKKFVSSFVKEGKAQVQNLDLSVDYSLRAALAGYYEAMKPLYGYAKHSSSEALYALGIIALHALKEGTEEELPIKIENIQALLQKSLESRLLYLAAKIDFHRFPFSKSYASIFNTLSKAIQKGETQDPRTLTFYASLFLECENFLTSRGLKNALSSPKMLLEEAFSLFSKMDETQLFSEKEDFRENLEKGLSYFYGTYSKSLTGEQELRSMFLSLVHLLRKHGYNGVASNLLAAMHLNAEAGMLKTPQLALSLLHESAKAGNMLAQYNLGKLYCDGTIDGREVLIPIELEKGFSFFFLAAQQGYSHAQYRLGLLFVQGKGVEQDQTEGLEWFKKAAARGHLKAQREVIRALIYGRGINQDAQQAKALIEAYSQQKPDQFLLQEGLLNKNIYRNHVAARNFFERAYQVDGNIEAAVRIGEYSFYGMGGAPKDAERAFSFFRLAAEAEYPEGQHFLGSLYLDFNLSLKSLQTINSEDRIQEGLRLWQEAGHQGWPLAQQDLGEVYYKGAFNQQQDMKKAHDWFTKAAHNGYSEAYYYLARMQLKGELRPEQPAMPFSQMCSLLQKAADRNDLPARFLLGKLLIQTELNKAEELLAPLLLSPEKDEKRTTLSLAGISAKELSETTLQLGKALQAAGKQDRAKIFLFPLPSKKS